MMRISPKTASVLPAEFVLAAACCRWPLSASALSAIAQAAAQPIDWPYFMRIVARQRIAGLAAHALGAAGVGLPADIERALAARAQRIARQTLLLAAETIRLQRIFAAAGIPMISLKGSALAQLAYGRLTLKHGRDIDILVPPEHALAGMALLEASGYTLRDPAPEMSEAQRRAFVAHGREAEFTTQSDGGLRVELHWRLFDNALLLRGIDAYSPVLEVPVSDGQAIRTFTEADLFAYLCVHGATHSWSRLKWLADFAALIATRPGTEIVRLYRHAQARGAGLCAGQALTLARDLLDLRLPPVIEAELAGHRRVQRLVTLAREAMIGVDAATEPDLGPAALTRTLLTRFLLGQGLAFYAAQCRFVGVAIADVIRFPLPPTLYFLYPVMRFPSWVWRRLR